MLIFHFRFRLAQISPNALCAVANKETPTANA